MKFSFFVLSLLLLLSACGPQIPAGYENADGQTLLAEGLARHEQGKFEEALQFFDAAYYRFQQHHNNEKMAEVLSARSLTWRRLGRLDKAVVDLIEAVAITEGTPGVVLPLYNLAKTQQDAGYSACVETYRLALAAMEQYKPSPHYREAVLNDMRLHLAVAELLFSQDEGTAEARALEAINALLLDTELDAFGRMVWVSGGYIGLSRYYINIDAAKAWEYFDLAESIVYAYPDERALRRQDIEALRSEMPERP